MRDHLVQVAQEICNFGKLAPALRSCLRPQIHFILFNNPYLDIFIARRIQTQIDADRSIQYIRKLDGLIITLSKQLPYRRIGKRTNFMKDIRAVRLKKVFDPVEFLRRDRLKNTKAKRL